MPTARVGYVELHQERPDDFNVLLLLDWLAKVSS